MVRPNLSLGRMIRPSLVLLLSMFMLVACSEMEQEESRVLRIGILSPFNVSIEESIRAQYINLFLAKNPNINIELIFLDRELAEREDGISQFLQEDPVPDVIISDAFLFPELIENNNIQSLEPYLAQSSLEIEKMAPSVLERLRQLGNGQLYSLAPNFTSKVLVYNKDIFTAANVEEPYDGMTWEELFERSQRLNSGTGNQQVIGFSFDPYRSWDFNVMQAMPYFKQLGLQVLNNEGISMNVSTEAWTTAWETLVDYYHKDAFSHEGNYQISPRYLSEQGISIHAFLSGKGAMTLIDYYNLESVRNANRQAESMDDFDAFKWDVVTMPVQREERETGSDIMTPWMFSINTVAQNSEDSWRLLEYIHSEEWARIRHQSMIDSMVIYPEYIEQQLGLDYNAKAFYQLHPPPVQMYDRFKTTNNRDLISELEFIAYLKFQEVIEKEKTIEEALAEWQIEGNDILLGRLREGSD